jgi:hypothetical protein
MFNSVMGRAIFGFLCAAFAMVAANAAIVRSKDPLLFWSDAATKDQPFFATPELGNFSRYVFTGLMRRLSYRTLWLGPSYATPFGSTPDTQNELMVSMGNMTGEEMADLLAFEASLGKATQINLVVSPMHFTSYYYKIVRSTATFPSYYYGNYGGFMYLLDPQMTRLALARVKGGRDNAYLSENARTGLNRRYFWMPDDRGQLEAFWVRYSMAETLKRQLATLRTNLPLVPGALAVQQSQGSEPREILQRLFSQIEALPSDVRVNFVFPPAHLSYWAHPAPLVAEALVMREAIIEFAAERKNVKVFDFEADWNRSSDRTYFYDAGHFTDRNISKMRAMIREGKGFVGDIQTVFDKFLATGPDFDSAQIAVVGPVN